LQIPIKEYPLATPTKPPMSREAPATMHGSSSGESWVPPHQPASSTGGAAGLLQLLQQVGTTHPEVLRLVVSSMPKGGAACCGRSAVARARLSTESWQQ
jgi:hypothetical protein